MSEQILKNYNHPFIDKYPFVAYVNNVNRLRKPEQNSNKSQKKFETMWKTVLGTDNVLTVAIDEGVKTVICFSTDKVANSVNAMDTSKAMMGKVIVAKAHTTTSTKICCTRYGNVMCSHSSVIPLWIEQIKAVNPITITEPNMTRFIISLDEAVDLVLFAFENVVSCDILG